MKLEDLRKRVLYESGILATAVVVLTATVLFLGSQSESFTEQGQALEREVNNIDLETNALKMKYMNIQQNVELYKEIQEKQANNLLSINRQSLLEQFNTLKTQEALQNMRLSMAAVADMKDEQYKRKTSVVNATEVSVNFEATTDENAYDVINSLQSQLPGVSKVSQLTLTHDKPLTDEVIKEIAQKGSASLIKADLKFMWYGINPVETPAATAATPPEQR